MTSLLILKICHYFETKIYSTKKAICQRLSSVHRKNGVKRIDKRLAHV